MRCIKPWLQQALYLVIAFAFLKDDERMEPGENHPSRKVSRIPMVEVDHREGKA